MVRASKEERGNEVAKPKRTTRSRPKAQLALDRKSAPKPRRKRRVLRRRELICWRCGEKKPIAAGLQSTCADCAKFLNDSCENAAFADGARTKCDALTIEKAAKLRRAGLRGAALAGALRVDPATLWRWGKHGAKGTEPYVSYCNAVDAAASELELELTERLIVASKIDPAFALKVLERQFSERWSAKQGIELTGANGGPVEGKLTLVDPGQSLASDLEALAAKIRAEQNAPKVMPAEGASGSEPIRPRVGKSAGRSRVLGRLAGGAGGQTP